MNRDNSDNGRKQERLARRRERERQARSQETAEKRERRLSRRRERYRAHRTEETAQARQAQMDANRVTQQLRRDTEMLEDRQARLQQMAATNQTSGKCNKCSLIQSLRHSTKQLRAKVIISTPGGNYLTLDVFGQNVAAIAEIDEAEVTADNLISAQPFSCSYNGTVMNSVTRP